MVGFEPLTSLPLLSMEKPGKPYSRGRISTVDLLLEVACFVKRQIIFSVKKKQLI
jgi:hypothetical protein